MKCWTPLPFNRGERFCKGDLTSFKVFEKGVKILLSIEVIKLSLWNESMYSMFGIYCIFVPRKLILYLSP